MKEKATAATVAGGSKNPETSLTNQAEAATPDTTQWKRNWRRELQRLEPLALPLLPCKDKNPGGILGNGWQSKAFTAEVLQQRYTNATGIGTRTGAAAGGLVSFDIDGATAIERAIAHGCDPREAHTWQVHRNTDPSRLKVHWLLTSEQQHQWGDQRPKLPTRDAIKDNDGTVLEKAQALEVIHHSRQQVIILGEHPSSNGFYYWPEGMRPEALAPIPEDWWQLALEVLGSSKASSCSKATSRPGKADSTTTRGDWRSLNPCPVCSRNTTGFCSLHVDGRTLRCFHGSTFYPPPGLQPGEMFTDSLGKEWAFSQEVTQADGHVFSTFVEHDPESTRKRLEAELEEILAGFTVHEGNTAEPSRTPPRKPEALTFRDLLAQVLAAIRRGDQNAEMELRTELITRFRLNDSKINAELFRLLTSQEAGSKAPTYGAVDMSAIEPMEWLLEGFIPVNDQVLLYGEAGTGKTTAAIAAAFAVIDGTGLLDHTTPPTPGKVLFISSDSGRRPLSEVLERSNFAGHPALTDGRLIVWAHSKTEARKAWDASIAGSLALLDTVKREGIALVLIDSCKAVTTKADIEYTSNPQVTALLTFFQEVLCEHCAVVWLNHDGTGKGMHAGAKAWREIPSMVHSIEHVYLDGGQDGQGTWSAGRLRWWKVRKCRMGAVREFQYELSPDTGRPQLTPAGAGLVIGDCSSTIQQVLADAINAGTDFLSRQQLVDSCFERGRHSAKTVDNTLSNLFRRRQLIKPHRGQFALAPHVIQELSLKGIIGPWEEIASEPSQIQGSIDFPAISRGNLGCSLNQSRSSRGKLVGKLPNTSQERESGLISSRPIKTSIGKNHQLAAVKPPADLLHKLVMLQIREPHAAPATLAIALDPNGTGKPTGRQVKAWLQWIAEQPDEFADDPAPCT